MLDGSGVTGLEQRLDDISVITLGKLGPLGSDIGNLKEDLPGQSFLNAHGPLLNIGAATALQIEEKLTER